MPKHFNFEFCLTVFLGISFENFLIFSCYFGVPIVHICSWGLQAPHLTVSRDLFPRLLVFIVVGFLPAPPSSYEMFEAVLQTELPHWCSWTSWWLSKPLALTTSTGAPVSGGWTLGCNPVCSFFRGSAGNSGHSPPWKPTWAEWTHPPASPEWSSQGVRPSRQEAKAVSERDSKKRWAECGTCV